MTEDLANDLLDLMSTDELVVLAAMRRSVARHYEIIESTWDAIDEAQSRLDDRRRHWRRWSFSSVIHPAVTLERERVKVETALEALKQHQIAASAIAGQLILFEGQLQRSGLLGPCLTSSGCAHPEGHLWACYPSLNGSDRPRSDQP